MNDAPAATETSRRLPEGVLPLPFCPEPRLRDVDSIDVGVPPELAYARLRHFDLARSALVRALFTFRTLDADAPSLRLDDLPAAGAGFHVLADVPGQGFVVGALGKFWEAETEYVEVPNAVFPTFDEPGWGRIVVGARFEPKGTARTRVVFELLVGATDDAAWASLRPIARLFGPLGRFLRHHLLALLQDDLGSPEAHENQRALPGDDLVPHPRAQATRGITVAASTAAIWPWLAQMGGRRAGWYGYDRLDHAGIPSARHVIPELQSIAVGDRLAATPEIDDGYDVAIVDPGRALVLHAVFDVATGRQVPAADPRPEHFFEMTWAFVLEPMGHGETRLLTRVRSDFSPDQHLRALARLPIHSLVEREQLKNLKRRAEGRVPRTAPRADDVLEGVVGAVGMLIDLATPFLRGVRSHWGLTREEAAEPRPGDDLVPEPRWSWTHGVRVEAAAADVWPWIAQLGQGRGGFYSYQFLENLAGCDIDNAEEIHAEWQEVRVGDPFRLHPAGEPMRVALVEPGRYFVVEGRMDPSTAGVRTRERPEDDVHVTWAFYVDDLEPGACRVVSRFRITYGKKLKKRLAYGPWLTESVGFMMDRRMLLGLKERAERGQAG